MSGSYYFASWEMQMWSKLENYSLLFFFLLLLSGYLIGGHVMRLCHGHDESLTIPGADKNEEEQRLVD